MSVHGRTGQAGLDWHGVPLQSFFRGNLLRYFTRPSFANSDYLLSHVNMVDPANIISMCTLANSAPLAPRHFPLTLADEWQKNVKEEIDVYTVATVRCPRSSNTEAG
jgi:hypothetical protein